MKLAACKKFGHKYEKTRQLGPAESHPCNGNSGILWETECSVCGKTGKLYDFTYYDDSDITNPMKGHDFGPDGVCSRCKEREGAQWYNLRTSSENFTPESSYTYYGYEPSTLKPVKRCLK